MRWHFQRSSMKLADTTYMTQEARRVSTYTLQLWFSWNRKHYKWALLIMIVLYRISRALKLHGEIIVSLHLSYNKLCLA